MSTTSPILPIFDGDSRDKLLGQLSDIGRYRMNARQPFRLMVVYGDTSHERIGLRVLVYGITAHNELGSNWHITGRVMGEVPQQIQAVYAGIEVKEFQAWYSTRTRKGQFQVMV